MANKIDLITLSIFFLISYEFLHVDLRFFQHVVCLLTTDVLLNKSTAFVCRTLGDPIIGEAFLQLTEIGVIVVLIININKRTKRRFQQHGRSLVPENRVFDGKTSK